MSARRGSARIERFPSALGRHLAGLDPPVGDPVPVQDRRRLGVFETRPEEGTTHGVAARPGRAARVAERQGAGQGGPERPSGVPCRRLHPEVIDHPFAEQAPVGNAVECDPAGQAQATLAGSSHGVGR
jgi:hypothetical protein